MSIFQSNKKTIINNFKLQVNKISTNYSSPIEMFSNLRGHFDRIELMVIDSACKKMPLEKLYNTLLLKHDTYLELLRNATIKLKSL